MRKCELPQTQGRDMAFRFRTAICLRELVQRGELAIKRLSGERRA
jgi:hypothetical protein